MAETGQDEADISKDSCAVGVVSADASIDNMIEKLTTEQFWRGIYVKFS